MKSFFTVIIPALNEESFLPRLLEALSKQTFKDFDVILVDASSTDKTVQKAKAYTKKFPLQIAIISDKNISRSRNIGAQKAKGQYFVFVDADNYIQYTFLERMHELCQKGYDMIIPAVLPDSRKTFYKLSYSSVNYMVRLARHLHLPFSTGGNFVIKKEAFEDLKGFDESIFVGEDHDIVARANKTDKKIAFSPSPKVIFSVRRFEKEGAAVLAKYLVSTVYIALFGKITKKIYNYQMGGDYYSKKN